MSNQPLDVGDVADIPTTFKKRNPTTGAYELVDPTTVAIRVLAPSSAAPATYTYQTDGNVTRVGLGNFLAAITLTEAGVWKYQWVVSGSAVGTDFGSFTVRTPSF